MRVYFGRWGTWRRRLEEGTALESEGRRPHEGPRPLDRHAGDAVDSGAGAHVRVVAAGFVKVVVIFQPPHGWGYESMRGDLAQETHRVVV